MTTHYQGSKGAMLITDMEPRYLKNALAKLKRERSDDSRDAEIAALEAQDAVNDAAYLAANPQAKPDYEPGDEIAPWNDQDPFNAPNPRVALGDNQPPEDMPAGVAAIINAPDVAKHWAPLAITLRNTKPIGDLAKVKADAAAIIAVDDDAGAEKAGNVVVELRRVRQAGADAFTAEKAPILAATRVCDDFGRPFKALETEQQRIERLIGAHQQKVATAKRAALDAAAAAEQAKADELLAAAAQQETSGNDVVGEILMDHAQKAETFAAIHETRAAAPVAELAKTQTATVALGVRAPWTAEISDVAAIRNQLGLLGPYMNADAILAAAKAYVRANVVGGKFDGEELPGVRIFQDVRGTARG